MRDTPIKGLSLDCNQIVLVPQIEKLWSNRSKEKPEQGRGDGIEVASKMGAHQLFKTSTVCVHINGSGTPGTCQLWNTAGRVSTAL